MRIVSTAKDMDSLNSMEREWVYNGLDCCVTAEVLEVLLPQLDKWTAKTYEFSRQLQAPVLNMRMRGIKVDLEQRTKVVAIYEAQRDQLETNLLRIASEGAGYSGFDWGSRNSLARLFYDICKIPSKYTKAGNVSVNRAVLEDMWKYDVAKPFIKHMTKIRELTKRLDVLNTDVDKDDRYRTSYNIAGTSSGRFSSSISEFGTGGNLQNIEETLRSIFIADEGYKLANFDAEQGESRVVGAIEWNLFHKGHYLDACESGDLHTSVARICWPDLVWGNNPETNRKLAEQPYYRHHTRRDMCKKLGHGTNYGGKPPWMSVQTKIELPTIIDFQSKYFKAFPAHMMWHEWVRSQLDSIGIMISLMGRKRHFFGRRDADDVFRDAVAYDPQGSLVDIVNQGMLRVHHANDCQLLLQLHDALLVQYPEEREDEIIPKILQQLYNEIPLKHNRTLTIPYGCKTGWNWGKHNLDPAKGQVNPNGLKEYRPGDQRTRET